MRGITRSVGLLTNVCVSTRLVANISTVSTEDKLKLWHCSDARSLRCLWTLEEIGYKNYELVTMPFPPRVFHKEFLKTNPLGTIPFFEGKDGLKMTESCGIAHYLAAQYAPALCIAPDDKEYGVFLNWLYHADATLTFPQAICLRYTQLQPGRADAAVSDYLQFHLGRLRLLDSALQDGREFLVGGRFTVADVCVAYSLYLGQSIVVAGRPMSAAYSAPAQAYLARMAGREGFQRALAAQAQITV